MAEGRSNGKGNEGGDEDGNPGWTWKLAAAAAAGIGIAASAWEASKLFGSVSEEAEPKDDRKKMKAPGKRGKLIYRDDFVHNPRGYFQDLYNEEKSKK